MRPFLTALAALVLLGACSQPLSENRGTGDAPSRALTSIQNADPSVIRVGTTFYSVEQRNGNSLWVRSSPMSSGVGGVASDPGTLIYSIPAGYSELWAPEFFSSGGTYYVYFTMKTVSTDLSSHRMFVISSGQARQGYGGATLLNLADNRWAIDGVPIQFNNQWWFVWSGWAGTTNGEQNLYLSRMSGPTSPTGPRYIISQPREWWEKIDTNPTAVNEGPQPLKDPNGQLHIVYSANGSWGPNYGLADLRLRVGGDPTNVWDWFKSNGTLFGSLGSILMSGWTATTAAKGVGHHSFALVNGDIGTSPPAGSSFPFLYHGVPMANNPNPFWFGRYWYSGTFCWWGNTSYTRGSTTDTGYSLKFFE